MFRQVLRRYPPATSLPRLARPSYSTLLSTRTTLLPRAPLPPLHGPGTRSISHLTTGTHRSLRVADNLARATAVSLIRSRDFRAFHATPRNDGLPVLPFLAGFLKASVAMDIIRTAARIALTFLPVVMLGSWQMKRKLRWAESRGDQELVNKIKTHMNVRHQRHKVIFFYGLLILPVVIFWATILASMERTPLTGRWRLILLSPEEEEEISAQLAGNGWYQAVGDILSQEGDTPAIVPPSDWRFLWVRSTLRRLESVIPLLQKEGELEAKWLECGPDDIPLPPPADYPLRPRPRASEFVRRFAELSCGRAPPPVPHGVLGPPYSLIVVDKPDSSNAFSYGFGPDGGGGIVVFSGFLDDIMSKYPPSSSSPSSSSSSPQSQSQQQRSWLSSLFGGLFPASSSTNYPQFNHPMPTEEQTSELAILLAHELAHLILSHHLETLSSGSIIWPGILSIGTDVIRALIFPFTMMFGPFVNDALAGIGKAGSGEFTKLTEYCTSQKQEVEADVVSARLLAHAGFDPRHAVRFWEERANEQNHERTAECTPMHAAAEAASYSSHSSPSPSSSTSPSSSSSPSSSISTQSQSQSTPQSQIQSQAPPLSDKVAGIGGWELAVPMRWMGTTHPYNVVRVGKLRDELKRWERKREEARRAREETER